jgi:tyrosine-protein kinase
VVTASDESQHAATLHDYLSVVRRRIWIVVATFVLVPAAAVGFSLHQEKLYQASAQVLLNTQNLAAQLTGTAQSSGISEPQTEVVQTQAKVARVPGIAVGVLRQVPQTGLTTKQFLADSSVSAVTNADLLSFAVTNHDPALARQLVDAYAKAYTVFRRALDTASIKHALAGVNRRIAQLGRAHDTKSALYASLVERAQTLQTMQALQTSNASVVKRADGTTLTQPKTLRNGILGLVLGLVLGLGLAFLRDSLDTRMRSAEEIGHRLGGFPLLGRVPAPPKRLSEAGRLAMLDEPAGVHAETYRMVRTNLDFVSLDRDVRTIMITSAVEREGKSTTIANLAVALALAGKRVVLVDLDLRRPILDRLFRLEGPGLTQVALGRVSLEEAMVTVALTGAAADSAANGTGNGNGYKTDASVQGLLQVLPSGPIPPDPGEFVGAQALARILAQLREQADIVLIDAPPVLHVGDATTLSSKVDGIVVATRLKTVRRNMLNELARQLATVPTPVLGYVVTGAGEEQGYGYGYGYGYHARPYEQPKKERAGSQT